MKKVIVWLNEEIGDANYLFGELKSYTVDFIRLQCWEEDEGFIIPTASVSYIETFENYTFEELEDYLTENGFKSK